MSHAEHKKTAEEIVDLVKSVKEQKRRKKKNSAAYEAALENIRARRRFIPRRIKADRIKVSF